MLAGPKRGLIKLAAFFLIGTSFAIKGVTDFHEEERRTITPISITGTIINLHSESGGAKRSDVQHYNVVNGSHNPAPDLHDRDPVFLMKSQNGEQVEVTYTKESGYVTHLRVTGGHAVGYEFNERDTQNYVPSGFLVFLGIVTSIVGIFQWIVDRNAGPAL